MRRLHGLFTASTGPVVLHTVAGGTHNDTYLVGGEAYLSRIREFLLKVPSMCISVTKCLSLE